MTSKLDSTARALLISDRALLLELGEQACQARKAAVVSTEGGTFNVLAADAQKARDCALRAEVLLTVVRATKVDRRHPDALAHAIAGLHERVWDYFDEQATA